MPAFATYAYGVGPEYQIPDALWERFLPVLDAYNARRPPKKKPGRARMEDRRAMTAIFYVARTACQWKALPRSLGAGSTVHDRFQEWQRAGVFERLWKEGLLEYDLKAGLDWEWQAMDGAMTKAPLGGESDGQEPHRPGEARREAVPPHRRPRHAAGGGGGRSQPARLQAGAGDAREPGAGAARP